MLSLGLVRFTSIFSVTPRHACAAIQFHSQLKSEVGGGGGCSIGIKNETVKAKFQADTIFSDPNICLINLSTFIFTVGPLKPAKLSPKSDIRIPPTHIHLHNPLQLAPSILASMYH